jgi:chromosome segregation ATPase
MKLNPFRRKSSGYFNQLKADYASLSRELESLQSEVARAKADFDKKHQTYVQADQASNSTVWTPRERELLRQRNHAEHLYDDLKSKLGSMELQHRSLRWKVEAPGELARYMAELKTLTTRRKQIETDRQKQQATIAKLEARIDALRSQIDQETESATQALLESDGEATGMSDALVKHHNDLKLLTEAHAKARQQEAAMKTELDGIPEQLREHRRCIESGQASVAEIDLHEQMPDFIQVIARAAVSKARVHGGNRYLYEIEIPAAAAEAAYAELEAEMAE